MQAGGRLRRRWCLPSRELSTKRSDHAFPPPFDQEAHPRTPYSVLRPSSFVWYSVFVFSLFLATESARTRA